MHSMHFYLTLKGTLGVFWDPRGMKSSIFLKRFAYRCQFFLLLHGYKTRSWGPKRPKRSFVWLFRWVRMKVKGTWMRTPRCMHLGLIAICRQYTYHAWATNKRIGVLMSNRNYLNMCTPFLDVSLWIMPVIMLCDSSFSVASFSPCHGQFLNAYIENWQTFRWTFQTPYLQSTGACNKREEWCKSMFFFLTNLWQLQS